MKTVRRWLDALYLLIERFGGISTFSEVLCLSPILGHLTGYSVSGYELQLYCQKKQYTRKRRSRWCGRTYTVFRVYSVVSQDAPACLKEACELDICLPVLMPSFISEELQREVVVQAYLDILISRLTKSA